MRQRDAALERGARRRKLKSGESIYSSELYYSEAISHAFVTKQYAPSFPPNEPGMSSFLSAPLVPTDVAFSSPVTAPFAFSHGTIARPSPAGRRENIEEQHLKSVSTGLESRPPPSDRNPFNLPSWRADSIPEIQLRPL